MFPFDTKRRPVEPDAVAPDGSEVRLLCRGERGGVAEFALAPGRISRAIEHRTVDEIWYFTEGSGRMWRQQADRADDIPVEAGVSITIPVGTRFQFRADADRALVAIGVTMPPWPGDDEAIIVEGMWDPNL